MDMDEISLMYESIIITEMEDKVIAYVERQKDALPFDHIFGDKMRIFVPLTGDDMAREIINDLKQIKDFYKVDIHTGEVIRKIKLDPKYGRGAEKEQKVNMGKAINSLKIDPETKKKYLNWYAKYKDDMETALENKDYAIILSRSPIDLVRMSDHNNISSCHSRTGSYFECAVQEAITGGAIAYLVDHQVKEDYEDDPELQRRDFFSDSDRGVRTGIAPLARFRVRRIEADDGTEMALPDRSIYGKSSVPGFFDAVVLFIKDRQSDLTIDEFKSKKWDLRGGTYEDSHASDLVRNYYGDYEIYSKIKHNEVDQYSEKDNRNEWGDNREETMREELEHYHNIYTFNYCSVNYSVDDNGEGPYFWAWGDCSLDVSDWGIPEDIEFEIDDTYSLRRAREGKYDEENGIRWSVLTNFFDDHSDLSSILRGFKITSNEILLNFEDENMSHWDTDAYDTFLDNVKDFDKVVEPFLEDLENVLRRAKILSGEPVEDKNFSRLLEWEAGEYQIHNNFEIIGNAKRDYRLKFNSIILLPKKRNADSPNVRMDFPDIAPVFNRAFWKIMDDTFKYIPDERDDNQKEFTSFFENFADPMADLKFVYPNNISVIVNYNDNISMGQEWFYLKPLSWDNKMFAALDNLDDIYPHIINTLKLYIGHYLTENYPEEAPKYLPSNFENLKKIYKKYL